jgi:hypothetical protein
MSNELIVVEEMPKAIRERADTAAKVARDLVLQSAIQLQGKRYIPAEGWQSLAAVLGLSPKIVSVQELENGDVIAVAEIVRVSDGNVLSRAEGYCGTDEHAWAKRPRYARRGMAQTRAISRACRSCLSWVLPLVDRDLEMTPAEEIPQHQQIEVRVETPRPAAANVNGAELKGNWTIFMKLFQEAKKRKLVDEAWQRRVLDRFNVGKSSELTDAQLAEIIAGLESLLAEQN